MLPLNFSGDILIIMFQMKPLVEFLHLVDIVTRQFPELISRMFGGKLIDMVTFLAILIALQ